MDIEMFLRTRGVRIGVLCISLVINLYGIYYLQKSDKAKDMSVTVPEVLSDHKNDLNEMYVYINGAVHNPGVYKMATNSRVVDLVKASGGFSSSASLSYIEYSLNLSAILQDQDFIRIPMSIEDNSRLSATLLHESTPNNSSEFNENSASSVSPVTSLNNAPCSLNTSTKEQLLSLKGIGEVYALKIINARPIKGYEELSDTLKLSDTLVTTIKEFCPL